MSDAFKEIALQQSIIREQWLSLDMAVQEIVSFERLFGEGHFLLACHVALPSLLTPELLHLIRLNFLDQKRPFVPAIAEMDFLLSPLCRPADDSLFEVEPMIREALLFELEDRYGWLRLQEIANFLLQYLRKQANKRYSLSVKQSHEWIAQSYLQPDQVVKELHTLLIESIDTRRDISQTSPQKSQLAHIMELVANPLERTTLQKEYHELIHSARILAHDLYGNRETWRIANLPEQQQGEQNVPLFPPAVEQWLKTVVPSHTTGEEIITSKRAMKVLDLEEINALLWRACDTLRGTVDISEYKSYILIMLFLKYISDAWQDYLDQYYEQASNNEKHIQQLLESAYFVIPEGCSFDSLYHQRHSDNLGELINLALEKIEDANQERLKGVFRNVDFNSDTKLGIGKDRTARLRNLLEDFANPHLDLRPSHIANLHVIGNASEHLIARFASSTGKKGGEFYTPPEISRLLVNLLDPQPGERVCDPVCGIGSLLIEATKHVKSNNLALYGQEINSTTWVLAKINIFLHGINNARIEWGDTLRHPLLVEKDRLLRFDVVVANPPFSLGNWGADVAVSDRFGRFHRGIPKNIGDFAFIQHVIETMDLHKGRAGVVMPHGVLFRGGSEGKIRQKIIEENLLDAVIGLPSNLFYGTGIPAAILLFRRNKRDETVVFIDASHDFEVVNRRNKLGTAHIQRIIDAYQTRTAIDGYCYVATKEEIAINDFNINVNRYISYLEDDVVEFQNNEIERKLVQAGWTILDYKQRNISKLQGVALKNVPTSPRIDRQEILSHYWLYIDRQVVGVVLIVKDGYKMFHLDGPSFFMQPEIPRQHPGIPMTRKALPFAYAIYSNGLGAHFKSYLEPQSHSRAVFTFHRPETLVLWLEQAPFGIPNRNNDLFRSKVLRMPALRREELQNRQGTLSHHFEVIQALEHSLAENRPRVLLQMATGTGKISMMIASIFRLIRYGGARRILILVDRTILAIQALEQFQQYTIAGTDHKFTDLYNVQMLEGYRFDLTEGVFIATPQRLLALFEGEMSLFPGPDVFPDETLTPGLSPDWQTGVVIYNPKIPIEYFDVIFADECHYLIYDKWRAILEYFDAFIIGIVSSSLDKRILSFFKNHILHQENENIPAVLIVGPPHSGKSVLAYNLSLALHRYDIEHYVLRAVPDGEGNWFQETSLQTGQILRHKDEYTGEFIQRICADLEKRQLPFIIDSGGFPQGVESQIFQRCTHALLLLRPDQPVQVWQDLVKRYHLQLLAEFYSDFQGTGHLESAGPILRGTLVGLERGKTIQGQPFNTLIVRLGALFEETSQKWLEAIFNATPTETVINLAQMPNEIVGDDRETIRSENNEDTQKNEHVIDWLPAMLPSLLDKVPAQTPLSVYGRAPHWAYSALLIHTSPVPFYLLNPRCGWIEPLAIQTGVDSYPEIAFSLRQQEGFTLLDVQLEDSSLDYNQTEELHVPQIPTNSGLVIAGRIPTWLSSSLALHYYQEGIPWVAGYYPQEEGAVVVASRVSEYTLGDLIPLPARLNPYPTEDQL